MKKIIIFLIVLLLAFSMVFADQDQNKEGMEDDDDEEDEEDDDDEDETDDEEDDEEEIEITHYEKKERVKSRVKIRIGKEEIETEIEIEEETENETDSDKPIRVKLSNGRKAEIKVMPETASERALERLRLRNCNEENNCSIVLKEVGKGNETRAKYEIQIERHSKILGIFRAKMKTKVQVDAENGEEKVMKPWWAFLAYEPEEELN